MNGEIDLFSLETPLICAYLNDLRHDQYVTEKGDQPFRLFPQLLRPPRK